MKKLILSALIASVLLPIGSAEARIFGRRWFRPQPATPYMQYSYPRYSQATSGMATSDNGYRAYSYQPQAGQTMPYDPDPNVPGEYQQSSPAYGYPTQQYRNETGEPYHDAGFKVRGF
jgi:hypothetical protein